MGEAVYSKYNNYGTNDQRIEDDLITNGKKAANDKEEAKTLPNTAAVKYLIVIAEKNITGA